MCIKTSSFFRSEEERASRLLSQLLPYDPAVKIDDRLEAGLKEYLLLLSATKEAITHLQAGDLKYFDPLVGENSCQIRAVKLALTISSCAFDTHRLLNCVNYSQAKIKYALANLSKINKRKISLHHFLDKENCEILLNAEETYLIQSYILTRTKVLRTEGVLNKLVKNDITNTKKIKELGDVGSLFAKNFVAHLRKQVSLSTIEFIQGLSKKLCPKDPAVQMVSQAFTLEHNGVHCIPCYWSTRIALANAFQHGMPIVIKAEQKAQDQDFKIVENATIFYEPTSHGYRATSHSDLNPEAPALILMGSTCRETINLPNKEDWIRELLEYCPMELVLAYAAAHRQYPDESKDLILSELNNSNHNYHKIKAIAWGCSLENPSLFFLAHAYCDKIKNVKNV